MHCEIFDSFPLPRCTPIVVAFGRVLTPKGGAIIDHNIEAGQMGRSNSN
jgi:hypothetical protein